MRSYIVNSIPVQAESPREAARTLYPHAKMIGASGVNGKANRTTWVQDDQTFVVEEGGCSCGLIPHSNTCPEYPAYLADA